MASPTQWTGIWANSRRSLSSVEDRGAWRAAVHGVSKSQTWLSDWTTTNSRSSSGKKVSYADDNLNCVLKDDYELPGDGRQRCERWVVGRGGRLPVRKAEAGNRLIQAWVKDWRGDRWVGGLRSQAGGGTPGATWASFFRCRRQKEPMGVPQQAGKNSDFISGMELVENGFDQSRLDVGCTEAREGTGKMLETVSFKWFHSRRKSHQNVISGRMGVESLVCLG